MKHAGGKTVGHAHGHLRTPEVAVASDRGTLTLTIRIQVKGAAQHSLLRHSDRLKSNVQDLVDGVLATPRPNASVKRLTASLQTPTKTVDVRADRTKQSQGTIGVVSSDHLRQTIVNEADDSDQTPSAVARDLFDKGLAQLEERLWNESSVDVLREFKESYDHFTVDPGTQQWSLRVPRRTYLRCVMLAREHGLSNSQLACWCVAVGLELVPA
jgi:hypothetical protein